MNKTNNSKLTFNAQRLRREMTKQEKHLWYDFLVKIPKTINRQKVLGKYIVDFYCACAKIVIELDGSQHYESKGKMKDSERDAYLQEHGMTVLRYSNRDIDTRFDDVCADILKYLL